MVHFSPSIKTFSLYVIGEKQGQIWAKIFGIPKNMDSRTPMVRVICSGVFEGRQARHLPRPPAYNCNVQSTLLSSGHVSVGYFAFRGAPNSSCNV